jgi:signal transduction histidine kinase
MTESPAASDERIAIATTSSPFRISVIPQFGAAVVLAADNERLLAAIRHDVIELRASRARIVETGDAARRRLERNLHDGAQQRMLSIVRDLSIARDAVAASADPRSASLDRAVAEADATIEALRALARGIYPTILEEAGLAAALEALVDEAPLPVVIEEAPDARFNPTSESAIWRLVARCAADAGRRGAAFVRVAVAVIDGRLTVRIEIDGLVGAIETVALEDVVGAAGGNLATARPSSGTMRIQADLPCE